MVDVPIDILKENFKKSIFSLRELKLKEETIQLILTELEQKLSQLMPDIGWRENFLNGYFGGDRKKSSQLNQLKSDIDKFKSELQIIQKTSGTKSKEIVNSIKTFLRKESPNYKIIVRLHSYSNSLHTEAINYSDFLNNAKDKIESALNFLSWDSLIQHPQAASGLKIFFSRTLEFNLKLKEFERVLSIDLNSSVFQKENIHFDTQDRAMDSFNALSTQSKKASEVAIENIKLCVKEANLVVEEIMRLLSN